ncbi:MAG: metallophosphoesterase [Endomicrobia bacterium]|nr:metallophosphoesterase [Endomicrobiia bacterium]
MKIVVIGCIHNDIENLPTFFDKLSTYQPDVLISVGDISDSTFPKGFSSLDIGRIFLEEVKEVSKNVLVVPGTWDKELIDFFEKKGVSLHGRGKVVKNVGFYGFGGAQTPFNTPYEPSEKEIEEGLIKGFEMVKNLEIKIQLTHSPPFGTVLDIVGGRHVGSQAVRKCIEILKPQVAVCSHIHEGMGKDRINETTILNVGKFFEGYFGLIEIDDGKIQKVELMNLI